MNRIGNRIKTARKAAGLTQQQLAQSVGVSRPAVTQWETEEATAIGGENLVRVAAVLKVRERWLMTGEGPRYTTEVGPDLVEGSKTIERSGTVLRRVPVLAWGQACQWSSVIAEITSNHQGGWIPVAIPVGDHAYGLRVLGDSMAPLFPEGCYIVVDPELEPGHGSYVVVDVDRSGMPTFKQLVIDGSRRYLRAINPQYPMMELPAEAIICGVVRGMWVEFH